MKSNTLTIAIAICAFLVMGFAAPQEVDNTRKATVQKVDGIEVYIMSEPVRAYETVGDLSVYDTGFGEQYIDDWVQKYVKKAKKMMDEDEEKDLKIDAIIYTNGKGATAIKFK